MRFRGVTATVRIVTVGAVLLAGGVALAGTAAPSLGVHLRITGACQVDSGAVFAGARRPGVSCRQQTPHAVSVTREGGPEQAIGSATGTRVVTLTF